MKLTGKFVHYCGICKLALDRPDDPTSLDCGGDCLKCMAEAGDPECLETMAKIKQEQRMRNAAIWKYPLETTDNQVLQLPIGASVLCLQLQNGVPTLWALVPNTAAPQQPRRFTTYGTGHAHASITGSYVGTYQLENGRLVFHVFMETDR